MSEQNMNAEMQRLRLLVLRVWGIIGCAIIFVLAIRGLGHLAEALQLLLMGMILGFVCSPVTNWLEDKGVKRGLAAFLALVLLLSLLALGLSILVPSFVDQSLELARSIPNHVEQIQVGFSKLSEKYGFSENARTQESMQTIISGFSTFATEWSKQVIKKLSTGLLSNILTTINSLVVFFLGLVLAYWFAKDYPKIIRELACIAGPSHKDNMVLLLAVMSRSMGGYMRGVVIMSIVDGFLSFLGFSIIGHPYAGLMGVIIGCLHFIPVVGPWISSAFAALVALFVSPWLAFETLFVIVIVQNVTDNLIGPLVFQSAVKVHPILSLVAIAIGASLGGVIGMTLAIPLSAAIKGVFVYYFEAHTNRQLVSLNGALFKSTPFKDKDGQIMPAFDALDDARFFETSRLNIEPESEPEPQIANKNHKSWYEKYDKALLVKWKNSVSKKEDE